MKEVIGWTVKNVLVALIPFGIGALIRSLSDVHEIKDIFDAADLCFSMAMLSMLVISSASRLTDKGLRDSITNGFAITVVLFIVLFTITSLAKTQVQSMTLNIANQVARGSQKISDPPELEHFASMLSNVWKWVVIPSTLTVFFALFCKVRYKLED